jgi:hypothetical protein
VKRKPVHEMTLQELREEVTLLRHEIDHPFTVRDPGFAGLPHHRQPTTFRVEPPPGAAPPTWCGGAP